MSYVSGPDIHGDIPFAASAAGLFDRKELSAIAFERTRMPMIVADARQPDYPIVLANKAFLALTGYDAEEILGRNCRFLQGEATSAAAVAEVRSAVAEGRETTVELLNYRKDGSAFWNQLYLSPILDDEGDVAYFFASQIDVTEHHKVQVLEASEHRLLMEVDHRAKNVLAMVDSVVRLSRADDPARYATAVQQRVQALSRAHGLLAERGWNKIALRDVVEDQVRRYQNNKIEIQGPQIMIPARIVQPLALVIHELAVNAAVHGALSTPGGQLRLTWEKRQEKDGGFRLSWTEWGAPPRTGNPTSGLGTIMVKGIVEKQLSGRVQRDWRDDGLLIVLDVPMLMPHAADTATDR